MTDSPKQHKLTLTEIMARPMPPITPEMQRELEELEELFPCEGKMQNLLALCSSAKEALLEITQSPEFKAKWSSRMESSADMQIGDGLAAIDALAWMLIESEEESCDSLRAIASSAKK
jgi:hypothetical protein